MSEPRPAEPEAAAAVPPLLSLPFDVDGGTAMVCGPDGCGPVPSADEESDVPQ